MPVYEVLKVVQFPDNRMKPTSSETYRILAKEPKDLNKLKLEEIQVLVHDLTTHQAELSSQNEQLRQIQKELQDSRDKYQQLYDSVPVGYFTINDKNSILEANATAAEMLNTSRSVLKNSRFTSFIAPPGIVLLIQCSFSSSLSMLVWAATKASIICYRIKDGNPYVADPNYPGNTERRIEYKNSKFTPYESGATKAAIDAGKSTSY
jgi:PAS domain-containing protein